MVRFEYQIPMAQVRADIDREKAKIEKNLNSAVDEILEFVPTVQVRDYTATSNPSRRRKQKYVRTFTLQRASKSERTSTKLPVISGRWYIDETIAPYGEFVLGDPNEQAKIHRGRWKSRTNVERHTKKIAREIVEKHLRSK